MALVKKNTYSGHSSSSSLSWSHMIDASSNLILIGVSQRRTGSISSVTVGGNAATFVTSIQAGESARTSVYKLANPPTGARTITVTFAGSQNSVGGSTDYSGAAAALGATAIREGGGSTTRDLNINVQAIGSILFMIAGCGGGSPTAITSTGSEEWFYNFSDVELKCEGASKTTTATGWHSIIFGTSPPTSVWWAIVGVEVKVNPELSLTEAVKLVSSSPKTTSKTLSQVVKSVPSFSKIASLTKILSQSLILSPVFSRIVSKTYSEVVAVISSRVFSLPKTFAETISATSSKIFDTGRSFLESIIGSEFFEFEKTQFTELVDSIKATSSRVSQSGKTFAENIVLNASILFSSAKTLIQRFFVNYNKVQHEEIIVIFGRVAYETVSVISSMGEWVIGKILPEVVKVFDAVGKARAWAMSEVLSITGSVISVANKVLNEIVSAIGSLSSWAIGKTLSQFVKMTDTVRFRKTQYKVLSDSVKAVGQAFWTAGKVLLETITAAGELASWAIGKVLIDPVIVVASYLKEWTLSRVISETIQVSGQAFTQDIKTLSEIISVSGEFILGTISKILSEAINTIDTISKSLPRTLSEVISISSNAFNQAGRTLSEALSVASEFVLGTISKVLIEPIKIFTDFITGGVFYKTISEAFSVIGSGLNQGGKIFIEVISASSNFILGTIGKVIVETVIVAQSVVFAITRTLTEFIVIVKSMFNQGGKIFTETASASNPDIAKATGRTFKETVSVGWAKIKLVLNGFTAGLWNKVARVSGAWRKKSRNDTL